MTHISQYLILWYSNNKRDLPWRETKAPYNIWVSEIILQQTRVNQGFDYYNRFIEKFPDIKSLAFSNIDELMKVWQGLGYYSRARNMHHTALEIVNKYNGKFPSDYHELIKLKGIGDYTASAIASISFNQATPVLDGNVYRVLARIFGISESTQSVTGRKHFKKILHELISNKNPGIFNQAIMEFGALQCVPKNPECKICPLNTSCFAYKKNMIDYLPIKKQKIKQKTRYLNYLHIVHNDLTFIEKRTKNDIWKLLYQFPLIETHKEFTINELKKDKAWILIFENLIPEIDVNYFEKKHLLSHQILHSRFYKIKINRVNDFLKNNYLTTAISKLQSRGVPRLIEEYLEFVNK